MRSPQVSGGDGPGRGGRGRSGRWVPAAGWTLSLAAALALYGATLAPDVVWHDAGDYQVQVARLSLRRPGDTVRVHPFFIVLGHGLGRLGVWSYARAASVTSAVGTALAVANVWLLVWLLVRCVGPASLAAGLCMVSHTLWQQGVQPQTYGWTVATVAGMLVLAVAAVRSDRPGWLVAMFFVGGLGISIHMMSQLAVAVLGVWTALAAARRTVPTWVLGAGAAAYLVGGGLYWYVMGLEYAATGDLWATVRAALVGRWTRAVFNVRGLGGLTIRSALMLVLNFPTPLLALAPVGLWQSRRLWPKTPLAVLLAVCLVLYTLFALRYRVPNQNFFFTPAYMLVAVYVGLGAAAMGWARRPAGVAVLAALTVAVVPTYWVMAEAARAINFPLRGDRPMHVVPYRDPYRYYLLPWQHTQTGPRRFAEEVSASLPERAVLFADTTTAPPLVYVQEVEGRRPDLFLATRGTLPRYLDAEEARRLWWSRQPLLSRFAAEGRRVFVASNQPAYMPLWMRDGCRLVPLGPVFEVRPARVSPTEGEP